MSYLSNNDKIYNNELEKSEQLNTSMDNNNNIDNINNMNINRTVLLLKKDIYSLKEKIKKLEDEKNSHLIKISELSKTHILLMEATENNKRLTDEVKIKQEIIEKLQSEIIKAAKENKEEQRLIENKFNNQLIYYKRLYDAGMAKENASSSILKLNETQHNYIKKLENKIDEDKDNYENKIKKLELDHENRYSKLKKQMMEFLKNSQKNMAKNNEENIELNSKLTILYKNQMLNELENQSHQIEELLKDNDKKDKEIYLLKQELIVHKKVEELIKIKNRKYMNFINKLDMKYNHLEDVEETNIENQKPIFNSETNIKSSKKYKSNTISRAQSVKLYESPKNLNGKHSNSFKDIKRKEEYNKVIFNNLLMEIIILINRTLDTIIREKEITKIPSNNLFSENFNFNSLNDEQKCELLIEVMKKIFSVLHINKQKDNILLEIKNKIDSIKVYDNKKNTLHLCKSEIRNTIYKGKLNDKIKNNKLMNMMEIYKKNDKDFLNIKNKEGKGYNKKLYEKIIKYNNNKLLNSFRGKSPFVKQMFILKRNNNEDIKCSTFFRFDN